MASKIKNPIIVFSILLLLVASCKEQNTAKTEDDHLVDVKKENVVEVITTGMDFEMVDQIPSGWTTFKYINNSYEPHFFILEKMPDTLGIATYKNDLFPPFTSAFEHFEKGEIEAGMQEFENIPDWFYNIELAGGVGLTSQKTTSLSTLYLEPGKYVMECYVRMPNGMPHTFLGMIKELTVTDALNANSPPKADNTIEISSDNGITFVDSLKAGNYMLSVTFKDQKQYEHLMGHDVNLVQIDNDSLIGTLNDWLNIADFKAFRTPSPDGLKFLGGVEDLPAEKTGYFEVNLEKGHYVLISEIPNAVSRNMIKRFSVY